MARLVDRLSRFALHVTSIWLLLIHLSERPVFNAIGESIAVATVPVSAIAPLRPDQMPAVRSLEQVAG